MEFTLAIFQSNGNLVLIMKIIKFLGIQPIKYKLKFKNNRAPVWILILTQQFEIMNEFCLR